MLFPLSHDQRRMLVDTRQLWGAFREARRRLDGYAGSMVWQEAKGGQYLVRRRKEDDGRRSVRSLGPRSPEAERLHAEFHSGREAAREAQRGLAERIGRQARLNVAADLGRVPGLVARLLRRLDREGLLGRNLLVAGTNAIYAYEAAAGVRVGTELLATLDVDILLDARARLRLTAEGDAPRGVLQILRLVDRSFAPMGGCEFCAVNRDGFQVDLIKPEPHPSWKEEADGVGEGDLKAAPIRNMRWIANAPRFEAVAIGEDGAPVPMVCPDPRAFALCKLWMGTQDATRDPVKRPRDVAQAEAVAAMVRGHMPGLPFRPEHLTSFPREAIDLAGGWAGDPFFEEG